MTEKVESASAATSTRYDALLRISRAISGCSTPEQLFRMVADESASILRFKKFYVLSYLCKDNSTEGQWYALGPANIPFGYLPVRETQSWWVHVNQRPLLISDWGKETRFPRLKQFMNTVGVRSSCAVPLATTHRRLGAFAVSSASQNAYSEEDLRFLNLVANHVALALDDAFNFEASQHAQAELQREKDRLKMLLELTNGLVSHFDLRDLLRSICVSIRPIINCDSATLILPDAGDKHLRVHANEFPLGKGIIRESALVRDYLPNRVFRTGRYWNGNLQDLSQLELRHDTLVAEHLRTVCVLPLISRGRTLGILSLGRLKETTFSADDIKFGFQIANELAIALDNSLNFEELRRARRELQREEALLVEGQRLGHTGSWRWQPATGNFVWSQQHFRIFGFDPLKTILSIRGLCRCIHPEDRTLLWSVVSKAVSEKGDFECDFRIILPDGSLRCIHSIGHAIVDDSGGLVEFDGTSMDVTERKRAEDEKAKLAGFEGRFHSLTSRQQQVMKYVAAGMLNKQIAAELSISEIMVKVHRRKMMRKMRVESLAELARIADRLFRVGTYSEIPTNRLHRHCQQSSSVRRN
jgi:GAF domain-containing protein/DNA-binding CsgD family transcriptional regulator